MWCFGSIWTPHAFAKCMWRSAARMSASTPASDICRPSRPIICIISSKAWPLASRAFQSRSRWCVSNSARYMRTKWSTNGRKCLFSEALKSTKPFEPLSETPSCAGVIDWIRVMPLRTSGVKPLSYSGYQAFRRPIIVKAFVFMWSPNRLALDSKISASNNRWRARGPCWISGKAHPG